MKNTLRIDFEHNTIVMDRTFAKNCENTFSDEYRHLQKVRADYPEYNIITKIIRRNPNKDTYKGLTYDFMERYILSHGSKEEVATNLDEYREMRFRTQCHGRGLRYPTMKKWFLAKYPEVNEILDDVA